MEVKKLIEIIEENYLLEFFFECERGLLWEKEDEYDDEDKRGINSLEDEVKWLTNLGLNNFEDKGGRADTSQFWSIVYFKDYDVYLKISGTYDSYGEYEHEYDTIKEVKPKQVTETIYE